MRDHSDPTADIAIARVMAEQRKRKATAPPKPNNGIKRYHVPPTAGRVLIKINKAEFFYSSMKREIRNAVKN